MAIICIGLFCVLSSRNYFKQLIGLTVLQSGTILFFIAMAKVAGGRVPILNPANSGPITNPLPHVLMLTAIVVGLATLAVGLALLMQIQKRFGSVEDK
jgi:multicomponent Na+:H+ antiporter subunit C